MTHVNYYELLGVRPDAQFADIRAAYRRLAMQYHPDKGGDPEMMKLLNEAYETLSRRRAEYNAWLAQQEAAQQAQVETAVRTETEAEARARAEAEAAAYAEARRRAAAAEKYKYHIPLTPPPDWMQAIYYAWYVVPIIAALCGAGAEGLLLYLITPLVRFVYLVIAGLILGYDV